MLLYFVIIMLSNKEMFKIFALKRGSDVIVAQKLNRGERGWMGQGLGGTEGFYVSSCNDRKISL
jgi:hypothetical protein